MSANIIFVGNYKGGVGKTTSVLNFAHYFSKAGKKVLALDIDPQSSLSEILVSNCKFSTLKEFPEDKTLNYLFDMEIMKIEEYPYIKQKLGGSLISRYEKGGFDFVPSSLFYRGDMGLDAIAIKRMKDHIQYLSILKNWVDTIIDRYDTIFIDCPPSDNLITRSAFLMSDYYIIPTILDGLSTNGVLHYIDTVNKIYLEYCEDGEDQRIAKYVFGRKPELLAIFYNMIRGQVDYSAAKADFEREICKLDECDQNIILDSGINNYIDIARSAQSGIASITKKDFEDLATKIMERL